jgi:hypothetical protein
MNFRQKAVSAHEWISAMIFGRCSCGNPGPLFSAMNTFDPGPCVLWHTTVGRSRQRINSPRYTLCRTCFINLRDRIRMMDEAATAQNLVLPGEQESIDLIRAALQNKGGIQ